MRSTVAAAALAALALARAASQVTLDPPDWNIGRMEMDRPATRTLTVTNTDSRALVVTLISTCGCLEAEPSQVRLAAGASAPIQLRYAPEEPGKISVYFVVQAAPPGEKAGASRLYQVKGMADAPRARPAAP